MLAAVLTLAATIGSEPLVVAALFDGPGPRLHLSPADIERLRKAAARGDADAVDAVLSPCVLAVVSINPEARVKVARGPAAADLAAGRPTTFLVKLVNEGGVRAPLRVGSPQAVSGGFLTIETAATLSGTPAEYAVLRLTSREAGKREATLHFDVGQGSQDLGFRAELPVLFRVAPGSGRP
jgi:hypothetical protein